jgi:hypothetical protein
MPHFEDPPEKGHGFLLDALKLARTRPGEWLLVKPYKNQSTASMAGTKFKDRLGPGIIETRTHKLNLYIRTIEVETKG